MYLIKTLPNSNFTRIENDLWNVEGLSDGGLRLYGFIASRPSGKNINDAYLRKSLKWTQATLTRKKKELKDLKLLLVVRKGPRTYEMYLGYLGLNAEKVRQLWEAERKEEDNNEQQ